MEEKSSSIILLTGGTGFIGSFLGVRLLEEGYHILFLVRKTERDSRLRVQERLSKISYLTAKKYESAWETVEGDISLPFFGVNELKMGELKNRVSKIFHCAASLSFNPSNEAHTFKVNVGGTKNAIEVAKILGAELHHLSTAYIAGDRTGDIKEDEFDEGQDFRNIYDKTKFEAEKLVRGWIKQDGRATIYRPSIVVGDSKTGVAFSFSGYYVLCYFFWNFYRKLNLEGRPSVLPLPIPVARGSTLNLIPVDMVVDAIFKISKNPENLGSTFHIVHPKPPYNALVFSSSIRRLGFPRVKVFQVSRSVLHLLVRASWVLSWFFGRQGKFFRRQIVTYLPYFDGSIIFKSHNIFSSTDSEYSPMEVSDEVIGRMLKYAMNVGFKDGELEF